jgi:sugar lactone lactonase YvrE
MLRTLVLALILTSIAGSALAPSQPITALAPFDVVADGFGSLRGIVVDGDDHLYVTDREAGTVTRLGIDGRRVVARRLDRPVGIALDPSGRLLVAEERAGRVVRLDPGGPTAIVQGIKQPRWLAVSERGTLYVSARRLTRDADPEPDDESVEPEVILALTSDGALSVFADGFDHLQGLVAQGDAVFAATTGLRGVHRQGGVVYRIPRLSGGQAGPPTSVGPRDLFERPVGLAIDRLGALYLSTPVAGIDAQRSRQVIVKLLSDGTAAAFATALDAPRGLAFDRHGHLYVADGASGRVLRFLAPAPPGLAGVPSFTREPVLALTGTTLPRARVDVLVNARPPAVSVPSTATGTFGTAIALVENLANAIEVFATGSRGNGLTSPPAEVSVVHDGTAPGIALQAPPAGAFVRGSVTVRADAADAGSGVATLGLSAAGRALATTMAPPLPAPAASASATWDTAGVADGTQPLTALAVDRAGNAASVTRTVIVDNTPPETEIVEGPSGVIGAGALTFTFKGTDNLASAGSLQFAWRLDGGPLAPFTGATALTLENLPAGDHVFEVLARDPAGNQDPTPARRTFTTSSLGIAVTEPAVGATVPAGRLLVRGTVDGGGLDVGVSVNGFAALVHGTRWAVEVPIDPGENLIVATATGSSGAQATASITVIAAADTGPAIVLRAEPSSGVAPLAVTWQVSSRAARPIVRFELDPEGSGAFGTAVATLDGTRSVYTDAGLRMPTVRAVDDEGRVYLARTIVLVDDAHTAASRFQDLWAGFGARLRAGDAAGALGYLSPRLQPRFALTFQRLGSDLPQIAAGFAPIELLDQVDNLAESALVQIEDGAARLYFVYFRRDNRGRWLIDEM